MPVSSIEQFWQDLTADIKSNRVTLPALPDIAIKTRALLEDPKVTAAQIAKAISADVVLTTRLIRIVNSPLYRATAPIDNVKSAVTRLGNANVRSVVTTIAVEQIYQDKLASPLKRRLLQENREHSMMVAALSYFIAHRYTSINPEEAMLTGLIHDIGKLPILEYAELYPDLTADEEALGRLLDILHPRVGVLVLRTWKFQPEMIAAVGEHENLQRDPPSDTGLTDVIIVANLLSYVGSQHRYTQLDWSEIPAFRRLALTPEESIATMKTAREQIHGIKQLLAA
jgi:putative nucleotidyltransferase with HDIG domain